MELANIANTGIVLYDLQMKSFDGEPEWAVYADEHAGIEYFGTSPGDSEGVISVHVRHISPIGTLPYEVAYACRQVERDTGGVDSDSTVSDQLGPNTAVDAMSRATRLEGVRTALGYNVRKITEHEDADRLVEAVTFSYPRVDLLNKFLDDVDTSAGLRFQEYSGGMYTLLEATEAFEQGYYLVATDQPYQTHEHGAFHVLGAMGMVDEYLETNRDFTRSVLARRDAELELPAIPGVRTDIRGYDFLRPAHHLARAFGLTLDASTGSLGESMLVPQERSFVRLRSAHELLYGLRGPIRFEEIPYRYRNVPDPDTIERYTASTLARYNQLEAHAEKLVA
jgi:hypothetical protein